MRAQICEGLEYMGLEIDLERNKVQGQETLISKDSSRVKVVVIPTDEEFMIASDTEEIVSK